MPAQRPQQLPTGLAALGRTMGNPCQDLCRQGRSACCGPHTAPRWQRRKALWGVDRSPQNSHTLWPALTSGCEEQGAETVGGQPLSLQGRKAHGDPSTPVAITWPQTHPRGAAQRTGAEGHQRRWMTEGDRQEQDSWDTAWGLLETCMARPGQTTADRASSPSPSDMK